MQTAVVTGGAGFIGSNLVDKLIEQDIKVIILDNLSTGKKENINPKASFYDLDISNTDILRLQTIIKDTDVVFHLAALARVQPSIEQPLPYHDVNVTGTHNLLVAAARTGVKKFIFSSSSSVYGNASIPTSETHPDRDWET